MRIKNKYIVILISQIVLIFISYFVIENLNSGEQADFYFLCRYGTLISIILLFTLIRLQGKTVTCVNLVFLSFCIFQFGLPMIFSFNQNYYNYYIGLFSYDLLKNAAIYSVISIQVFCIGNTIALRRQNCNNKNVLISKKGSWSQKFQKNIPGVTQAALLLFIASAIIFVPIIGTVAIKQLLQGSFFISNRDYTSSNAILRFVKEYIFSSGLLFLCFNENKFKFKIASFIYIMAAIFMLMIGDRSYGLSAVIVLIMLCTVYKREKNAYPVKHNYKQYFFLVIVGIAALYLIVYLAQWRLGNSISGLSFSTIFSYFFSELGFNFVSICFVMSYVPESYSFLMGESYIGSILLLIPKTFDFLGLYDKYSGVVGENWLYTALDNRFDFGVGFSLIAESYLNFSWAGLIVILFLGIIIANFLSEKKEIENRWDLYIRLVLLMNFITLPRRSFFSMIKTLEYAVFFMGIYLLLYLKLRKSK